MKFIPLKNLLPFVVGVLLLASCKKDKCIQTITYKTYEPVYMGYDELRSAVKSEAAQALKKPGKIYLKGNYIFVNEVDKGIHVIDNSNPSSPQNIAFINIPGNMDIAAIGNTLYADSYIDLVTLDITNPNHVTVLSRVQNALPYRQYTYGYNADPAQGVAVDWKAKEVTEQVSTNCGNGMAYPIMYNDMGGVVPMTSGTAVTTTYNTHVPGIGGSSARFTIANNTLYIVDDSKLHVYNIANTANPNEVATKDLGWSIQTIFPYKDHLFIGSNSGIYIYDNSDPLNPAFVSEYSHITACDPVTVDDNYAYFTLSNDAPCHMGVNQLEVVDITNLAQPTLKITVPMTNPKGIGIDNGTLFICDSNDGLKVYDATDVMQIQNKEIAHFANINAFDVIPYNHRLLMIGNDGLYQYDYTDVHHISLLSKIAAGE